MLAHLKSKSGSYLLHQLQPEEEPHFDWEWRCSINHKNLKKEEEKKNGHPAMMIMTILKIGFGLFFQYCNAWKMKVWVQEGEEDKISRRLSGAAAGEGRGWVQQQEEKEKGVNQDRRLGSFSFLLTCLYSTKSQLATPLCDPLHLKSALSSALPAPAAVLL